MIHFLCLFFVCLSYTHIFFSVSEHKQILPKTHLIIPETRAFDYEASIVFRAIDFPLSEVTDSFTVGVFATIDTYFGDIGLHLNKEQIDLIKKAYLYLIFLTKLELVKTDLRYKHYISYFSDYLKDNDTPQPHIPSKELVTSDGWNRVIITDQDLKHSSMWQLFCKASIADAYQFYKTALMIIHEVEQQTFNYVPHIETSFYDHDYTNLRTINEMIRIKVELENVCKNFYVSQCNDWKSLPITDIHAKQKNAKTLESELALFQQTSFYKNTHDISELLGIKEEKGQPLSTEQLLSPKQLMSPLKEQVWCYFMFHEVLMMLYGTMVSSRLEDVLNFCSNSVLVPNPFPYSIQEYVYFQDLLALKAKSESVHTQSLHPSPPVYKKEDIHTPLALSQIVKKATKKDSEPKDMKVQWFWDTIVHSVTHAADDVAHDVVAGAESVFKGIKKAGEAIGYGTLAVGEGILGAGASLLGNLIDVQSLRKFGSKMQQDELSNLETATNDFNKSVDDLSTGIEDGIHAMASIDGSMVSIITDDKKLGEDFESISDSLTNALVQVGDSLIKTGTNFYKTMYFSEFQASSDFANLVASSICTLYSGNGLDNIIGNAESLLNDTVDGIVSSFSSLLSIGTSAMGAIVQATGAIVNSLTTLFIDISREATFLVMSTVNLEEAVVSGKFDFGTALQHAKQERNYVTNTLDAHRQTINQVMNIVVTIGFTAVSLVATGGADAPEVAAMDEALIAEGAADAASGAVETAAAEADTAADAVDTAQSSLSNAKNQLNQANAQLAKDPTNETLLNQQKAAQQEFDQATSKLDDAQKDLSNAEQKLENKQALQKEAQIAAKQARASAEKAQAAAKQAEESTTKASKSAYKKAAQAAMKDAKSASKVAVQSATKATSKEVVEASINAVKASAKVAAKIAARDAAQVSLKSAQEAEAIVTKQAQEASEQLNNAKAELNEAKSALSKLPDRASVQEAKISTQKAYEQLLRQENFAKEVGGKVSDELLSQIKVAQDNYVKAFQAEEKLAQAEANVSKAEQGLKDADAAVNSSNAAVTKAQSAVRSAKSLLGKATKEVEEATIEASVKQASLATSKAAANVATKTAQKEVAQAYASAAEKSLNAAKNEESVAQQAAAKAEERLTAVKAAAKDGTEAEKSSAAKALQEAEANVAKTRQAAENASLKVAQKTVANNIAKGNLEKADQALQDASDQLKQDQAAQKAFGEASKATGKSATVASVVTKTDSASGDAENLSKDAAGKEAKPSDDSDTVRKSEEKPSSKKTDDDMTKKSNDETTDDGAAKNSKWKAAKAAGGKALVFIGAAMNIGFSIFGLISGINGDAQNMLQEKSQMQLITNIWRFINGSELQILQQENAYLEEFKQKQEAVLSNQMIGFGLLQDIAFANINALSQKISTAIAGLFINILTPTPDTYNMIPANIGLAWGLETNYLNLYPTQGFSCVTTGRPDFSYSQEVAQAPYIADEFSSSTAKTTKKEKQPLKLWFNQKVTALDVLDAKGSKKKPSDSLSVSIDFQIIYMIDDAFYTGLYLGGTYYDYSSASYLAMLNKTKSYDLDSAHLAKMVVLFRPSATDALHIGVYEHEGSGWLLQEELPATMQLDHHHTYHLAAMLNGDQLAVNLFIDNDEKNNWNKIINVTKIMNQRTYGVIASGVALQWNQNSPVINIKTNEAARPVFQKTPEIEREKKSKQLRLKATAPTFGSMKLQVISKQALLKGQYLYQTKDTKLATFDPHSSIDYVVFAVLQNQALDHIGIEPSLVVDKQSANVVVSVITGDVYDQTGAVVSHSGSIWDLYQEKFGPFENEINSYIINAKNSIFDTLKSVSFGSFQLKVASTKALENGLFIYTSDQTVLGIDADGKTILDYFIITSLDNNQLGDSIGLSPSSSKAQALLSLVTGNLYAKTTVILKGAAPAPLDQGYYELYAYENQYGSIDKNLLADIQAAQSAYLVSQKQQQQTKKKKKTVFQVVPTIVPTKDSFADKKKDGFSLNLSLPIHFGIPATGSITHLQKDAAGKSGFQLGVPELKVEQPAIKK
ncbi:hypothetical protein HYV11_03795 [Candidatus Dependentiae bacterium]|nr:hypothetical protein [Candidatus Dependentiae bacterium]